jgi:hypothetical protein
MKELIVMHIPNNNRIVARASEYDNISFGRMAVDTNPIVLR